MISRSLGWLLGAAVVAFLLTPFARDFYHRYTLDKELAQLSDPASRASLSERYGSLEAFGNDLVSRCERIYGRSDPYCGRYRTLARN